MKYHLKNDNNDRQYLTEIEIKKIEIEILKLKSIKKLNF